MVLDTPLVNGDFNFSDANDQPLFCQRISAVRLGFNWCNFCTSFVGAFSRAIFHKRRQRTAGVKDACKLAR